MSSASCASDLAAWLAERVATARILTLWAVLTAAAWGAAPDTSPWTVGLPMVLLVVEFRLWDDLADRAYDAARHPERVVVRTAHSQCFAVAVAVLALPVAALLAATRGSVALGAYGVLLVAAAVIYKKSVVAVRHPWRAYAVLLKYPVFVALCAGSAGSLRVAAASVAVFGALAAFETLDDAVSPAESGWRLRTVGFALLALSGVIAMVMS